MIAELLLVFLIPLVWGLYELRQLRKPSAPPPPPPAPPPPDPNHPPSNHPQPQEERCRDRTTEGPRR